MMIQQLYADVTANIIKELEAGAVPWLKCWKGKSTGLSHAYFITNISCNTATSTRIVIVQTASSSLSVQ